MIILSYTVECDGPHPHYPDEQCEATFDHTALPGLLSDNIGLSRQMVGRGWRRQANQFYCPLHPTAVPAVTGDQP